MVHPAKAYVLVTRLINTEESIAVRLYPCLLAGQVDQFDELKSFSQQTNKVGPLPACPTRAKVLQARIQGMVQVDVFAGNR